MLFAKTSSAFALERSAYLKSFGGRYFYNVLFRSVFEYALWNTLTFFLFYFPSRLLNSLPSWIMEENELQADIEYQHYRLNYPCTVNPLHPSLVYLIISRGQYGY